MNDQFLEERVRAVQAVCDKDEELRSLSGEIYAIAEKSHPAPVPEPGDFVLCREGRTELTFRRGRVAELEAWLLRTEAEAGKPVYGIKNSRGLENLLTARCDKDAGFSKVARAAADQVLPGTDTTTILRGMRAYSRVTGTALPATIACMHSCVLVFSGSEYEVLTKVHNLVVPAKKAAPEKVAAKMALARIKKLHTDVTRINKQTRVNIAQQIDSIRSHLAKGLNSMGQPLDPTYVENLETTLENLLAGRSPDLIPELSLDSGAEGLRIWVESVRNCNRRNSIKESLRDLDRYLGRPDATDAVIQAGLDLVRAEEVMNS